jgi:hypothetical protein
MTQEKCQNYLVCNQFINKQINNFYCKDCLFYFNYNLSFKQNIPKSKKMELLICPICLESPKLFIKQKSCEHYICADCIYNIYFDKSYIRKMPLNPVYAFKKTWDLYIYSNQSYKFRTKIINEFTNYEFEDKLYNTLIQSYKYFIPNVFKKDLKELIDYQLKKNKFITEYKDLQYKKINAIKKCPYCRKCEDDDVLIITTVNNYQHSNII